jgi:formylglycine-generating enzyme required for sulfatase activity
LLSEAEFEYAARAGGSSRYGFGNDPGELCKFANGADQSAKAESLPANAPYMNCRDGICGADRFVRGQRVWSL